MVLNHLQVCHHSLLMIYHLDSRGSNPHPCKTLMVSHPHFDSWSLVATTCSLYRKVTVEETVCPPLHQLSTQRIHPAFQVWFYYPRPLFPHLSPFIVLRSWFTQFLLYYKKHSCYCSCAFIKLFIMICFCFVSVYIYIARIYVFLYSFCLDTLPEECFLQLEEGLLFLIAFPSLLSLLPWLFSNPLGQLMSWYT